MVEIKLEKGQKFIEGRSQETAARLVNAAKELGRIAEVITTSRGYIVPKEVAAAADEADGAQEQTEAQAETQTTESETHGSMQGDGNADLFDPTKHTVAEVKEYLDGANDEERTRVLEAEAAGDARATLVGKNEGAK